MTTTTTRRILTGFCTISSVFGSLAIAAAQTSSAEKTQGSPTVTTTQLSGVVMYTEGNTLVAKMPGGDLRTFTVPDTLKFVIDGRETPVQQLKPGTSLTATMVTTTTPVMSRTVTNLTGKVWYVMGNTVILTLPDGKNKMYKSEPHYKFMVNGREAEVSDLRKGMTISAQRIVEEPVTEVASNTSVIGTAPKPRIVAVSAPPPAPAPAPVRANPAPTPAPAPVAAAPVPAPTPAPVEQAAPPASVDEAPAELPKSGSPLPSVGILGLLLTGAGLSLRALRRP